MKKRDIIKLEIGKKCKHKGDLNMKKGLIKKVILRYVFFILYPPTLNKQVYYKLCLL